MQSPYRDLERVVHMTVAEAYSAYLLMDAEHQAQFRKFLLDLLESADTAPPLASDPQGHV